MLDQIMAQVFARVVPVLILGGLISILAAFVRGFVLPRFKGRRGESRVNARIRRSLDRGTYHLIPDVTLPTPDGTTQLDHVIVSRYGIFVVETKTYRGWIYGSERDAKWTQVIYKRKERFQNPLRQNYRHTKTLSDLMGLPHDLFKSVAVFAGDCKFKTEMPDNVVVLRDFIRHIKIYTEPIIDDERIPRLAQMVRTFAGVLTKQQKRRHISNLRRNRQSVSTGTAAPFCPRCGATMVPRTSKKGGSKFWGCPGYPKCRGMRFAV